MRPGYAAWVFHSLTFGALVFPSLVSAGLPVLYDSGDTRPLGPLLVVVVPGPAQVREPVLKRLHLGAADLGTLLPISSPGLTPGKVATATLLSFASECDNAVTNRQQETKSSSVVVFN